MTKSLVAFGWLRDVAIVLLLLAGNHIRSSSPSVGTTVILGALVVFMERFLWSWYICDLKEHQRVS